MEKQKFSNYVLRAFWICLLMVSAKIFVFSKHQASILSQHKSDDTTSEVLSIVKLSHQQLNITQDPQGNIIPQIIHQAWDERKKAYVASPDRQFVSRSTTQTAEGHKDGLWTTVVACAVMLLD